MQVWHSMHMPVTASAGMRKQTLIRKLTVVGQCRQEAGLPEHLA